MRDTYMDVLTDIGYRIKKCFAEHEIDDFFSKPKADEKFVVLRQPKYVQLFLMIYIGYLDELITFQLNESFVTLWNEKRVGYAISVEKMLLDNVFGCKEDLQKLLIGSGIFKEANEYRKVKIVTHGEGILPVIQQKMGLNPALKSYFLLAQLHETYIQLTLNQVVKTSSPEEDAYAIIVQEDIIQIENVNDTLCKTFWNYIKSNNLINRCTSHKDKEDLHCDVYSIKNYTSVLTNLKKYLIEIVSNGILIFLTFI